tara:strand:- start:202 stop:837 length:636 start_codon:yes stop_codon:yes gene_type:complete
MTTPTTIDNDTELSAVNSILGSIGQSPVTTLNFTNPETEFIYNILTEVSKDVQNEGWQFNLEENVTVTPSSNKISVGNQEIRVNVHSHANQAKLMDTVIRYDGSNRRVYSLEENKFDAFTESTYKADIVTLYLFEKIPNVFQRYITYRAAVRAATQLIANPQLVQLLQLQEVTARANCLEYEGRQGDHSFFGLPNAKRIHSQILARNQASG